ncbi:MAG: TonB-dependent receptor, partial [Salinisphaera sp.]|nr:TonB-dependent receptor [Salinisphaera sp.]
MKSLGLGLATALQLAVASAYAQESGPDQTSQAQLPPITISAPSEAFTNAGIQADREELRRTPGGVSLVEGKILDDRNISSMADMLRYVPGLYVVSDSGSSEIFFSSRGSNLDTVDYDMNGILLLKDGIPITTADGTNHNRVLNPLSARYAIVARGANGMKYGASTLGGAINFISPTAYDTPGLVVSARGGGHDLTLGRITASQVFGNGLDGLVTLESKHRDGFRDHTQEDQTSVYANAGWRISQSLGTRLYATYIDDQLQLAGGLSREQLDEDRDQANADNLKGDFQRNVETWRVASKTSWQLAEHQRLDIGLAYEEQQLYHPIVADFSVPGVADEFISFDGLLIKQENENVAATLRYEQQIGNHNLLFGTSYIVGTVKGREFGNNQGRPGGLQNIVDREAYTLTTYIMDRWQFAQRWTLIPALQYVSTGRQDNDTGVDDFGAATPSHSEGDYSTVNPRLGLIYSIAPRVELFANVSRTYEPPTLFVLDNSATGEVLDAMEGTVVEFGSRGRQSIGQASSWGWSLSVYYAWIDDEILTARNKKLTDSDPNTNPTGQNGDTRFVATNIDGTVHAGVEAQLRARIALGVNGVHAIEPIVSIAVNEFHFDNDSSFGDNDLPAVPGYVLRGEVLYRNANGFYAGPTIDLVDDRYADYENSYTVDSYGLLGVLAGWSNERVNIYLDVENLLDEEYVSTHSVVADAQSDSKILKPGPPLSVF